MNEHKAPIEKYFPIERVNEIAEKEGAGGATKRYYRPIYSIHKSFARRLGSVFRSINLLTLIDKDTEYFEPTSHDWKNIDQSKLDDPEDLWDNYYLRDIDLQGKKVLDPFAGKGVTLVEGLRMNASVIGKELNPVPWFITKKEIEEVDLNKLENKFEEVAEEVEDEISEYYKTECPECENQADVLYFFWKERAECLNCGELNDLIKNKRIAKTRSRNVENLNKIRCNCGTCWDPNDKDACPDCREIYEKGKFTTVQCGNCSELFSAEDYQEELECPHCEQNTNPSEGPVTRSGRYFNCQNCPQKWKILESFERAGKPEEKMFAIEYSCQHCEKKGYKDIEEEDKNLQRSAEAEFEEKKEDLPFPTQKIAEGDETRPRLPDHGYETYDDMFNSRQLLGLSLFTKKLKEIDDKNLREFILLALSSSLEYNNSWGCTYESHHNKIGNSFSKHAFHPRTVYIENNLLGANGEGGGTIRKRFELVKEAKEYSKSPFEKYVDNGETKERSMKNPINSDIVEEFDDLEKKDALLHCGDSSFIDIPDKSVDHVVTDPPYGGNVMYSELYDYFYVWLREVLNEDYDYFQSELTSKTPEVISNDSQEKDEQDYKELLADVFGESRTKLKDDGLMVFTFHHKDPSMWESVLEAVIDSGFKISAIYPILGEMTSSVHIHKKGNINYDMIFVCSKRDNDLEEAIWSELEDRIYLEAKEEISNLTQSGRELSNGDVFVITIGKCLELYSKHYPSVEQNGERVPVDQALDFIQEIVDGQMMEGLFDELADETDPLTATYLSYVAGKGGEITYNSLNKHLQQRNISINDLVDAGLIVQDGSRLIDSDLEERAERIEAKYEEDLTAVDRAHYLAYLKEEDRLASEMHDWASEGAVKALRKLGDIEKNNDFIDLADYVEEKTKDSQLNL